MVDDDDDAKNESEKRKVINTRYSILGVMCVLFCCVGFVFILSIISTPSENGRIGQLRVQ